MLSSSLTFSCPAVSQIWNLKLRPSTFIVFVMKDALKKIHNNLCRSRQLMNLIKPPISIEMCAIGNMELETLSYPIVLSMAGLNESYTKRYTILDLPTPDSYNIKSIDAINKYIQNDNFFTTEQTDEWVACYHHYCYSMFSFTSH